MISFFICIAFIFLCASEALFGSFDGGLNSLFNGRISRLPKYLRDSRGSDESSTQPRKFFTGCVCLVSSDFQESGKAPISIGPRMATKVESFASAEPWSF